MAAEHKGKRTRLVSCLWRADKIIHKLKLLLRRLLIFVLAFNEPNTFRVFHVDEFLRSNTIIFDCLLATVKTTKKKKNQKISIAETKNAIKLQNKIK